MKDRRPAPPRTQHRPSRHRPSERTAPTATLAEYFPCLVRGSSIGLLVAVLFCAVGSVGATGVLLSLPDPCAPLPAVAVAILLLGSLIGAAVAGRLGGQRMLLCGISTGALILLVMLLGTSLLGEQKSTFTPVAALSLRGAVMLFSLLGAYIGARLPARRVKRRR